MILAESWPKIIFGASVTVGLAIIGYIVAAIISKRKARNEAPQRFEEPLRTASDKFMVEVQRYRSVAEKGTQPNGDAMDEAWLALQQVAPVDVSNAGHSLMARARDIVFTQDDLALRLDAYRSQRHTYLNEIRKAQGLPQLDDSTRVTPSQQPWDD